MLSSSRAEETKTATYSQRYRIVPCVLEDIHWAGDWGYNDIFHGFMMPASVQADVKEQVIHANDRFSHFAWHAFLVRSSTATEP